MNCFKWMALSLFALLQGAGLQAQRNPEGLWQGKLKAGIELTLVFHIAQENGNLVVLLDVPQQGAKGIRAANASHTGDSIHAEFPNIRAQYQGRLSNDSTIDGYWIQGVSIPLILKRTDKIVVAEKPQTPKPPFPYQSQDLVFYNKDRSIQYGATLTLPQGKGPFPAVLLLTGSGQQNRDEEILGHKPFAVWADYLTRRGFAVLRVDDRDMGQTTGNVTEATTRDFANDAEIALDYLKARPEVNAKRLGLLGHSEGGMIAEIVAAERRDVSFVVLLAAPGIPVLDLMTEQNEAVLRSMGMSADILRPYVSLYRSLMPAIMDAPSPDSARNRARALVNDWVQKTPAQTVLATTGIPDRQSVDGFVESFVSGRSPWYRYFLHYDPAPYLRKFTARVLALNGDRDIQVLSNSNLAGIRNALKQSKSPSYEVQEIKGVNHLFQQCTACTVAEYSQLEQTVSPEVLERVGAWMKSW